MSASTLTFICPYLHLFFFSSLKQIRARCTENCPWLTPTNDMSMGCNDGSTRDTPSPWSCCDERGGRAKCPLIIPLMCANPNSSDDGSDYKCVRDAFDCDAYGGIRKCDGKLICGDKAYLILSSKAKFDYAYILQY